MLPGKEYTADSALKMLSRRRWLVIVPLFLGVLGGLLYSRSQPDLFRSDAVIQVVPQRVPESYVRPTVTERVEDRLRAIGQQVLSRTQLEKLINQFALFPAERRTYPLEDVIQLMTTRVLIEPLATTRPSPRERESDAFRISFDYHDPVVAQKVVEQLASFFIDTNARERGTQADQTSEFLDSQLADARGRLEAQEKKLEAFRERNSGRLPTQMLTNLQAIQTMQLALQAKVESLARDRDRKLVLERLYADATADASADAAALVQQPPGSPQAADPASKLPINLTPKQRLEAARNVLPQLEQRLMPKHPDVVRMRRLIAELERQVAAEQPLSPPMGPDSAPAPAMTPEETRRRDRVREMRAEIESLDRQIVFKEGEELRLRAQVGQYQARLEAVPGIESEWIALTRDYDTLQASYRELLSKSENSKMAASLEQRQIGEQFRILDPPRAPLTPFSPNRIKINSIGTLAGLGLGLLLIGMAEYRDSTIRTGAEAVAALELPVLVLVPFETTAADRRWQRRRHLMASAAVAGVCVATGALVWFLQLWKFVV